MIARLMGLCVAAALISVIPLGSASAEEANYGYIPPPEGVWFCYYQPTIRIMNPLSPSQIVVTSPVLVLERVETQEPGCT